MYPMLSLNWPEMEDLTVPQVFKIGGYLVYFWVNENGGAPDGIQKSKP